MVSKNSIGGRARRLAALAVAVTLGGAVAVAAVAVGAQSTALPDEKAQLLAESENPPAGDSSRKQQGEQQRQLELLQGGGDPGAVEPAWPSGIFEDPEAPMPAAEYLGVNRWQGEANNRRLAVYAGSHGTGTSLGLLISISYNQQSTDPIGKRVEFAGQGAVRVESAWGTVLTVVAASGSRYRYDAATETLTPLT